MQSRGNESLSDDLVKVLKTQDAGYIRTIKAIEQSVRPSLPSRLSFEFPFVTLIRNLQRVSRLQQRLNTLLDTNSIPPASDLDGDDLDDWDAFDAAPTPSSSSSPRMHTLFSTDLDLVRSADPSSLLSKRIPTMVETGAGAKRTRKGKAKEVLDPLLVAKDEAERAAAVLVRPSSTPSPRFILLGLPS